MTKLKEFVGEKTNIGYIWGYLKNGKNILLHRFLLNPNHHNVIDHINGNKKDNRKINLRECTQQQNSFNNSKALGVCWNKQHKKWEAYISKNKRIHLGFFESKEDALKERKKAEIELFGKFRNVYKKESEENKYESICRL